MKIETVKWDSDFFGYPVGKIALTDFHNEQFEELVRSVKRSGMRLIYLYPLDQVSTNTLLSNRIPLVDTKITFVKSNDVFSQNNFISKGSVKSYDTNEKYETLEKLALLSGEYSRFRTDPAFSNNEYYRLYSEWIKKSVNKEVASDVIIYKDEDEIKGFVSYKLTPSKEMFIGLVAVSPLDQGKGIGKTLMKSIENIALRNGIRIILVNTQLENEQAVAFYSSCGFQISKQQEIFHLWTY